MKKTIVIILLTFLFLIELSLATLPNMSTPVIPAGYYPENSTITANSHIYDADSDSLRANITISNDAGVVETQYISSVTSFENGNSNGWDSTAGGIISYPALKSEGEYVYHLAFSDEMLNTYSLSKTINLSKYDFIIFDYRILNWQFWIKLNDTILYASKNADYDGAISIYNKYINLTEYGGISTLEFYKDYDRSCMVEPWYCPNTEAYIDNIRLGAYFDNEEYNITSNTNVTTVFNLQSVSQDLFNVDDNITVTFNITDSSNETVSDISNAENISNRIPVITNITLKPILMTMDAALLS